MNESTLADINPTLSYMLGSMQNKRNIQNRQIMQNMQNMQNMHNMPLAMFLQGAYFSQIPLLAGGSDP